MSSLMEDLPADVLLHIYRRLPCRVDVRHMGQVCRSLRNAVPRPPPPLLPLVLLPHAGGPSFSCVDGGCFTHAFHVPEEARVARYFGSYDGGWLFLAFGQAYAPTLLNLRTDQHFRLPNIVRMGDPFGEKDIAMVILAATLSSPPEHEHCVAAAIISARGGGPRIHAFWCLGHQPPVAIGVASAPIKSPCLEDVIHRDGAFHFLTRDEHLFAYTPKINDDHELEIERMTIYFFLPGQCVYHDRVHARYLVESRGQLLMVVRLTPHAIPLFPGPTSAFRVFQMVHMPISAVGASSYRWNELHALGGRMLFVGRGCSRSYEVADYPGFVDGIYFLDDGSFYESATMFMDLSAWYYPCSDTGKWLSAEPNPRIENFLPGQSPSNYSPQRLMRRWRKEAEAALRLERDGHHDEAVTRAEELVAKHPESATTLSIHASSSCQQILECAGRGVLRDGVPGLADVDQWVDTAVADEDDQWVDAAADCEMDMRTRTRTRTSLMSHLLEKMG
ncbi:hypothetical protein GUJ93_ZPchr0007g5599 [Zizania palustris]|uniref:KIB1-4 beta-propeller domain-containing protein n=1 Tax=Zizania palustris TaxID=103762 RepID=A0A8J5T729_ZIZPA|nr:hypothetical protein GUJ93_ZPchr0007g5599 [Zizania palustris]